MKKKNNHPKIYSLGVICSCGNSFFLKTTLNRKCLTIDVCNKCHPFYSGKQRIIDTEKRVEFFNRKFFL